VNKEEGEQANEKKLMLKETLKHCAVWQSYPLKSSDSE